MSGGSWEYLYAKDVDQIIERVELVQAISERLASLGYAEDAARETQELVLKIRQFKVHASVILDRLSPVWRAIEWWDSCDTSEDDFVAALEKYRVFGKEA